MSIAVVVPVPRSSPRFLLQTIPVGVQHRQLPLFFLTTLRAGLSQIGPVLLATDRPSVYSREWRSASVVQTGPHESLFGYASEAVRQANPSAHSVAIISPFQPRFRRWQLQAMATDHLVSGREATTMVCPQRAGGRNDSSVVKVAMGLESRALWFSRGLTYHAIVRKMRHFYWHCGIDIIRADVLHALAARPPSPIELGEVIPQLRLIDANIPTTCFVATRTYPLLLTANQVAQCGPELGYHNQYY